MPELGEEDSEGDLVDVRRNAGLNFQPRKRKLTGRELAIAFGRQQRKQRAH
jgi:hypothetical protein